VLDADATVEILTDQPKATALFADFDGSLSRIVPEPQDAVALPAAFEVLRALVPRFGRVGIVSGRPIAFLAEQLPVPGLVLAGLYGLEFLVDGERRVDPRVDPYLPGVAAAADDAERRLPGILVERKAGVTVTLHWRTAAGRADEVCAVAAELAERYGLDAPQRGRKAVELRPPVPVDKGTAVDALLDSCTAGAFAGDDLGDVAAFHALARAVDERRLERAVRIGVHSPEAPPELAAAVDVVVDGPEGLVALLQRVVDRLQPA
jgi:trehalose 6-phosphate phosphatase